MSEGQSPVELSGISLRPAEQDDEGFFYSLYCCSRAEEIRGYGWDQAQQDAFLSLQFRGQQRHYRLQTSPVHDSVIVLDGQPIGRLIVIRSSVEIRLADIEFLPEMRGRGFGTELLQGLLAQAVETGLPVTLHVEKTNRAARLYQQLGFTVSEDLGIHLRMEWHPPAGSI